MSKLKLFQFAVSVIVVVGLIGVGWKALGLLRSTAESLLVLTAGRGSSLLAAICLLGLCALSLVFVETFAPITDRAKARLRTLIITALLVISAATLLLAFIDYPQIVVVDR